ncbi:MAG: hypothetical protein WBN04_04330 [Paracoccaceae bacterium]
MSDIIGPISVGPASHAARPAPQAPHPAVPSLENSQSSGTATDDKRRDPDLTARRSLQALDPMPGPPPAFEASLLELESDLQSVIKRVAAAREKARDLHAVAPESPSPTLAEPAKIDPATEANGSPRIADPYSREA